MAKKDIRPARGISTKSNEAAAKDIVKIWNDEFKDGLDGKQIHPDIKTKFEPLFFDKVLRKLNNGDIFTAGDKKATKRVAKDLGKVCKMMTGDKTKTVTLDTFEDSFQLLKKHPACPNPGGAGLWCNVQLV